MRLVVMSVTFTGSEDEADRRWLYKATLEVRYYEESKIVKVVMVGMWYERITFITYTYADQNHFTCNIHEIDIFNFLQPHVVVCFYGAGLGILRVA